MRTRIGIKEVLSFDNCTLTCEECALTTILEKCALVFFKVSLQGHRKNKRQEFDQGIYIQIWFKCETPLLFFLIILNYILYMHGVYAIWADEITDVMISIKKINKSLNTLKNSFLNKFCIIFHFLSLCVFISIHNISRRIPLKAFDKSVRNASRNFIYHRLQKALLCTITFSKTALKFWKKSYP